MKYQRNNREIQFVSQEELRKEYQIWTDEDEPPDDIWQNKIAKIKEE